MLNNTIPNFTATLAGKNDPDADVLEAAAAVLEKRDYTSTAHALRLHAKTVRTPETLELNFEALNYAVMNKDKTRVEGLFRATASARTFIDKYAACDDCHILSLDTGKFLPTY